MQKIKGEVRMQRKINKKTIIIAIVLIFATIISVFAISIAIQASKVATNANISPYKYSLVVAYYGYWESGGSYFADVDYPGQRKNIGKVPSEYAEFDLTFPTTLIEGNYEIDDIIDFRNYTGTWEDLNYNNISYNEFNDHYIEYASIWNPQTYIGEKNTEVTFTASFRLLNPPNKGFPGNKFAKDMGGGVYKCYIAVVVKYVDSDFLADPEGWWDDHGGNPDDPGDGDITVTIKYVDEDDKKLMSGKTRKTSLGANLVENSERIDGYKCTGYSITGKETKSFSGNSTSFVVGLFDYSTPVDDNLNITFHYEEYEEPEKPKCDPQFDAEAEDARVTMKRRDFDNATDIFFSNVKIGIDDFEGGFKQISGTEWGEVEGEHKFHSFDIYLKYPGSTSYDFTRYDIYSQTAYQNLNVPAIKFTPTNAEKTEYIAEVEVTLGVFCTCGGFNAEKTTLRLYVDIVENKPPTAFYRYATKKILPSGTESRVYGKAYIGKDVVIDNYSDDPNGLTDIDYSRFIFQNNSGQVKSIQFKMMPWGAYELDEADSFKDTSIIFNGTDNGNINVVFTTDEEWEVTLYVQDTEGLNDTYTETIRPEVLSLNPTAVIKDTSNYRYPYGEEFNGKQNRVIKLDSNSSYIASWLQDFETISIDHSQDKWQIEALDGQNISSVKFEREVNKYINGNTLNVSYDHLDLKIMFKEAGRYKIRLQVTDTEGNVSEWSDNIITIHEDLQPTVTANLNSKYYRNTTTKKATITFNALGASTDEDYTEIKDVRYKFDSDNDGSFDDETVKYESLTSKYVVIDGITYRQVTLVASDVGKYQFEVEIKEEFGQETLETYINEQDYKTGSTYVVTEIDNIAPVGTLGLQKESNIDVKVLTCGLSDIQDATVANNIDTLKSLVESQYNINCGDIEVVDMANSRNGLLDGNGLTWRRVTMGLNNTSDRNGLDDSKVDYINKEHTEHAGEFDPIFGCCLEALPSGVYATGWNGIELPHMWVGNNLWKDPNKKDLINHYAIGRGYYVYPSDPEAYVLDNAFSVSSTNNYVRKGYLGSYYGWIFNMEFSAISKEKIRDFDMSFDFTTRYYSYHGIDDHCITNMFLFDVQDSNNYYAVYSLNCNSDYCTYKDYERHTGILYNHEGTHNPSGIVKVKNGEIDFIIEYSGHTKDDGMCPIERIKKSGDTVTAYNSIGQQVIQFNVDDSFSGKSGYIGLGTQGNDVIYSQLNIRSLTYMDNSSIYDSIDKLSWGKDTDKYIINIVADNKLDEMTNSQKLIQTATKLQSKGITLINVGVSSINDLKLNQIVAKNDNNGTYIELGDISTNLTSAATYIRNKYSNPTLLDDYILLGCTVKYLENYSDAELDPIYSKLFRFYQLPTYFDNNLGTISNNNVWMKNSIETFNKTGKYTLSYQVRDNPLNNTDIYSLFDNYRKYSTIYNRTLYVHRKPIASFSIDRSFANNILNYFNATYDTESFNLKPIVNVTETITSTDFDIPSSAYDITLTIKTKYKAGTVKVDPNYGSTLSHYFSSGETYTFDLVDSATSAEIIGLTMSKATVTLSYFTIGNTTVTESRDITVNIPEDAIDSKFTYTSSDYDSSDQANVTFYADGVSFGSSVNDGESHTIYIPSGTDVLTITASKRTSYSAYAKIYDMSMGYYMEDININIPITENSYDLDHLNTLSNKGIIEWQWKVVCKDGTTTTYNTTNKSSGTNWVSTQLKNKKWHDATILLRVKDLEGAYSDWTSAYIDEDNLLDPNADNTEISISPPIADFELAYDKLSYNSKQTIYDGSSDPQGLALVYSWKVYKEGTLILSSADKNINNSLNEKILDNGIEKYSVKLMVVNTKGLKSDEVTKYFDVVLYNDAPTTNFNLVSNENPVWIFPKILGLYTLRYRPTNTLFYEEHARFDTNIVDPNADNTGFTYNWKLERFAVKDINNISGAATNTYNYTTQFPFVNSFKGQGLPWGAYRITLSATDKPPVPPYQSTDAKTATVTKNYYIVPEISLAGSFESDKSEIMVGDSIKLKAKTNKMAETVGCNFNGTGYALSKVAEDSNFAYWEKNIVVPDSITESGTYYLNFTGTTSYGGNGSATREVRDTVSLDIVALKLINFRITDIINHPHISFPQTKDMLKTQLIPYKAGYYVTFRIDSKGKPDSVYSRIDINNNGSIDQVINMIKMVSGDTETWQGRFYTSPYLTDDTVISIKLDCSKGTVTYNYNSKENWDGRSLIVNGSALQDGRVNLTN